MKRRAPSSKLSDRELDALLRGLREDVAAPPQFRGQVLQRLAQQGLIAAAPQAPAPSFAARFSAWISPARLGLLAGGACALALVLMPGLRAPKAEADLAGSPAPAAAQAQASVAAKAPAKRAAATLANAKAAPASSMLAAQRSSAPSAQPGAGLQSEAAMPAQAPAEAQMQGEPQVSEAVAVGAAPAPQAASSLGMASAPASASQAPQFSGGSAASAPAASAGVIDKPIVIEPTPTPLAKPLNGDSEVRNNVVRASRGESALIIFRLQSPGPVRVDIHDRLGRPVAVLKDATLAAGTYQLRWAGAADEGGLAASGIYQLRISAPGYEARHKLMLVK